MYFLALLLSVMCFVAITTFFIRHKSFNVFNPLSLYLIFHLVIFIIRPIVGYIYDYDAIYRHYDFIPSIYDKTVVIFASNLSLIVFSAGAMWAGNVPMAFKIDSFFREEKGRLARVWPFALAIIAPLGIYSIITLNRGAFAGDVYGHTVLDRRTGVFVTGDQSGYIIEARYLIGTGAAIIAWLGRFRIYYWIPLIIYTIYGAMTGGRVAFVGALVSAGVLYLYEKRLSRVNFPAVVGIVCLILAFMAVGSDRGASVRSIFSGEQAERAAYKEQMKPMESMDLANMEFFEYLVYVIPGRSHTYDYGLDNLQVLTEPIPRALWSGKPIGEPFRRIYLFDFGYPIGMTRSIPGEGWYAGGWVGVIIWSGLWGLAVGTIYRKFVESSQGCLHVACYAAFLASLIASYRDGQLLSAVRYCAFFISPIPVWYLIARLAGLPTVHQLRTAAAIRTRKWQSALLQSSARSGDVVNSPEIRPGAMVRNDLEANAWAALPVAVRRRRLALQKENQNAF